MLATEVLDQEGTLRTGEVADPIAERGEAVVRVESVGLAPGAFSLLRMGKVPILPTILGHEIAGVVESVEDPARQDLVGKRVRVHPNLGCGWCDYCTTDREMMCSEHSMMGHALFGPNAMRLYERYHNGGLAEKVLVRIENLDVLPDTIDYEVGAKIHDFANAIRTLKLAELDAGSTLIVTAASGAMGAAIISFARDYGVRKVIAIGRNKDRLDAVAALDPELVDVVVFDDGDTPQTAAGKIRRIEPQGAHAAIDFFPHGRGTSLVFGGLRNGSRIVHMGVNPDPLIIPPAAFSVNCITFVGTRNGTRKDVHEAMDIIASRPAQFTRLISHRFHLDTVDCAVEILATRSEPMWMGVVSPTLSSSAG